MFKDDCEAVLNIVKMSILWKLTYKFGVVYYIKVVETIYPGHRKTIAIDLVQNLEEYTIK